ncbi:hypothetical protein N185_15910 [Sinorhizobium sp. GW3]|nr:hypothetical protein N185_15910 [Sinorhizobium sp. GW3]
MFGFNRTPVGWQTCDGTLLSIAEYDTLFNLIGTTYGGDGVTTFGVPDLRGRVPVHFGNGPGLSPYVIGQIGGSENVTLLGAQLPPHNHPMSATTTTANATAIGETTEFGTVTNNTMYATDLSNVDLLKTSPNSTTAVGNNTPHDNTMPTLTVQFCISLFGIYPTPG